MMQPNVETRNFLRLLRTGLGADASEAIEPMSSYKWALVWRLATLHQVEALVADGIAKREGEFLLNIPKSHRDQWLQAISDAEDKSIRLNALTARLMALLNQEHSRPILLKGPSAAALYPDPLHRSWGDLDIFFPFPAQARKADKWARITIGDTAHDKGALQYAFHGLKVEHHRTAAELSNIVYNSKLQDIITNELSCCDSAYLYINETKIEVLPPALALLVTIVRDIGYMLRGRLLLKQLADLDVALRNQKELVDTNKLSSWLATIGISDLASLLGDLLSAFLHTPDAYIPVGTTHRGRPSPPPRRGDPLWSPSRRLNARLTHPLRFFRYNPAEAIASMLSSLARSISKIEE